MSTFDYTKSIKAPQKGEDDYLTRDEQAFQHRYFVNFETIPQEFWGAILQKIAVDGLPIATSQVQGLPRLFDQQEETNATLSAIGTTYLDQESSVSVSGAAGTAYEPTVTVLAGTYLCICTGQGVLSAGTGDITMRMWNNVSSTAFGSSGYVSTSTLDAPFTLMSMGSTTLSSDGTIRMWAAEGGAGSRVIQNVALVAIRTG